MRLAYQPEFTLEAAAFIQFESIAMLARVQQGIVIFQLALATFLLLVTWPYSRIFATVLFAATMLMFSGLLAVQFAALQWLSVEGRIPAPGLRRLVRAWCLEVVAVAWVFFWWQPFRSWAHPDRPDTAGRGVVLVHGFLCNRGVWTPWLAELERRKTPYLAINLEPVFGSIDHYVDLLENSIRSIALATGMPPLIVCHSMGGLVARAWLRQYQGSGRIHHIVTIGTPHQGTSLAKRISHPSAMVNASQMHRGSPWLSQLAQSETVATRRQITCYYSDCDNIVTPASSAALKGADNRSAGGLPHVGMALDSQIMNETLGML
jgi:predicted alpha/beta hydrolase family esterase